MKEVQDTLKTISTTAKVTKMYYDDQNIYSTECDLKKSRKFYYNRMKKATEEMHITGLLLVYIIYIILNF